MNTWDENGRPRYELEPLCMPPPRDSERAWPPAAAVHDGIAGDVVKRQYPHGIAPAVVTELAEQGLAELAAFRRADAALKIPSR